MSGKSSLGTYQKTFITSNKMSMKKFSGYWKNVYWVEQNVYEQRSLVTKKMFIKCNKMSMNKIII